MHIFVDYCFANSVNYQDTTLANVTWVASSFHCQYECLNFPSCQFFTYDIFTNFCELKATSLSKTWNIYNKISGPKICPYLSSKYNDYFRANIIFK